MTSTPSPVFCCIYCFTILVITVSSANMCRDRYGVSLPTKVYNGWTCAKCFEYLFPSKNVVAAFPYYLVGKENVTSLHPGNVKMMHVRRSSDRLKICRTLTRDQCRRWLSCCIKAKSCCVAQKSKIHYGTKSCPSTWDGYVCWPQTEAGTVSYAHCPLFIQYSVPTRLATKKCQRDGRWLSKADLEWTDYDSCLNREGLLISVNVALAINSLSVFLLVIAVLITFFNSEIRSSYQWPATTNLFIAFVMLHVDQILWEWFVARDRLSRDTQMETHFHQNNILCKSISVIRVYLQAATYVWLLANTVTYYKYVNSSYSPKQTHLLPYYIIFWLLPVLQTAVFCGLRLTYSNARCWANDYTVYNLSVSAPNALLLLISALVLISTFRVLRSKSRRKEKELPYVRRWCHLHPLILVVFGFQSFVAIYSPSPWVTGFQNYEHFALFINSFQGAAMAILLGFLDLRVTSGLQKKKMAVLNTKETKNNNTIVSDSHNHVKEVAPSAPLVITHDKMSNTSTKTSI